MSNFILGFLFVNIFVTFLCLFYFITFSWDFMLVFWVIWRAQYHVVLVFRWSFVLNVHYIYSDYLFNVIRSVCLTKNLNLHICICFQASKSNLFSLPSLLVSYVFKKKKKRKGIWARWATFVFRKHDHSWELLDRHLWITNHPKPLVVVLLM